MHNNNLPTQRWYPLQVLVYNNIRGEPAKQWCALHVLLYLTNVGYEDFPLSFSERVLAHQLFVHFPFCCGLPRRVNSTSLTDATSMVRNFRDVC
jgi:hypothetical protein